jgi:hypothetical protein
VPDGERPEWADWSGWDEDRPQHTLGGCLLGILSVIVVDVIAILLVLWILHHI